MLGSMATTSPSPIMYKKKKKKKTSLTCPIQTDQRKFQNTPIRTSQRQSPSPHPPRLLGVAQLSERRGEKSLRVRRPTIPSLLFRRRQRPKHRSRNPIRRRILPRQWPDGPGTELPGRIRLRQMGKQPAAPPFPTR